MHTFVLVSYVSLGIFSADHFTLFLFFLFFFFWCTDKNVIKLNGIAIKMALPLVIFIESLIILKSAKVFKL